MRQQIRLRQNKFWECKKSTETARTELIIELSNDWVNADQDPECKSKRVLQTIRERATNRKLTAVEKLPHQWVQSIDAPTGEWFYSQGKKEMYRFSDRVFEAHPHAEYNKYWNQYTYKVPHDDYKETTVVEIERGKYTIVSVNQSQPNWNKLTELAAVNRTLS